MASLFKSLTGGSYMNSHDDDAAAGTLMTQYLLPTNAPFLGFNHLSRTI